MLVKTADERSSGTAFVSHSSSDVKRKADSVSRDGDEEKLVPPSKRSEGHKKCAKY